MIEQLLNSLKLSQIIPFGLGSTHNQREFELSKLLVSAYYDTNSREITIAKNQKIEDYIFPIAQALYSNKKGVIKYCLTPEICNFILEQYARLNLFCQKIQDELPDEKEFYYYEQKYNKIFKNPEDEDLTIKELDNICSKLFENPPELKDFKLEENKDDE